MVTSTHNVILSRISLLLLGSVLLASVGCGTLREKFSALSDLNALKTGAEEEIEKPLRADDVLPASPGAKAKLLEDTPIIVADVAPEDIEGVDEKVAFPERRILDLPKAKIAEYPDNLIKGIKDPDEVVPVVLNLDATGLTEVVPLFGALLNFSYLIDPGVKGAVTMTVDSEMTAREAWQLFEHILWLSGAYASKNPGFIHIMPFAKMPQERRLLFQHEPLANVEVAFIQIYHVKSAELITNIKPFMTDGSTVTDLPNSNMLLIVEAPANMPKLRELITRLDTKGEASWPHICIKVNEIDAEEAVGELEQLLPVLGLPVTNKGPSGGQIKLTAIPRLQTIVASAALMDVLEEVERWIKVLDRSDSSAKENIFFYNVKHSTAEQLNEALEVFFNTSSTTSSRTSRTKSTSSKASATTGQTDSSSRTRTPTSSKKSSTGTAEGEGETIFDTPVIVYVDEVQNRLTIRTTQRAYALVQALLERHDVPTRQVSIQAIIADITLDKYTRFGFAYAAQHSDKFQYGVDHHTVDAAPWSGNADNWVEGVEPLMGLLPTNPATSASQGVVAGWINGDRMAFITAVAGEENTRLLSAPQIVAASGEEAKIDVGKKVSIKTSGYDNNDSTAYDRSTYEYQNTGTILTVTPYISAGNEVRMEIEQEVSDFVVDNSVGTGGPDITQKKVNTTLVVPDGGTVMMGGMISTRNADGHDGVPYLKDLPYIGRLFRTNVKVDDRTELLILITVNVIDESVGTTALIERYQAALGAIKEQQER